MRLENIISVGGTKFIITLVDETGREMDGNGSITIT